MTHFRKHSRFLSGISVASMLFSVKWNWFVLILVLGLAGCANQLPKPPTDTVRPNTNPDSRTGAGEEHGEHRDEIPTPPWQMWQEGDNMFPPLKKADEEVLAGKLEQAVRSYELAERGATTPELAEELFVRRLGTLLKLGRADDVLKGVTARMKAQSRGADDVSPPVSLVVAYAYGNRKQFDQMLAWLSASFKRARENQPIRQRAASQLRRVIGSLPTDVFEKYRPRWKNDELVAPIFSQEDQRRLSGGRIMDPLSAKWFMPQTYQSGVAAEIPPVAADQKMVSGFPGQPVIGVLLPLTGEFAEHAQRVKEGIELGAQELASKGVRVVFGDTAGDPERAVVEYDRLALQEHAQIVLGPMLVKTTERVAQRANELLVPLLSFTKKEGITSASPHLFRLGATAADQVIEILEYAKNERGVRSMAIAYPNNANGAEFLAAFKREASQRGIRVSVEVMFDGKNRPSMVQAVGGLEAAAAATPINALLIADSIENAYSLIELIRQSKSIGTVGLYGPAQWNDPVAVRGYARLIDGAITVTPFYEESERRVVQDFANAYLARFGRAPELLSAQAYDAVKLVARSFSFVPEDDTADRFSRRLTSFREEYEGVTGKLTMTASRDVRRRMSVIKIHDGVEQEVAVGNEQIELPTESSMAGVNAEAAVTDSSNSVAAAPTAGLIPPAESSRAAPQPVTASPGLGRNEITTPLNGAVTPPLTNTKRLSTLPPARTAPLDPVSEETVED